MSNFNRENLARAAMEAAIFGMRIGLEGFRTLGFKEKEIRLTGGGSKSTLWQGIAANIMNMPVPVPKNAEEAALGGAIQAIWAMERKGLTGKPKNPKLTINAVTEAHVALEGGATIKPDPKKVKAYNAAYEQYSKYLATLGPLYK
jgi:xylulokinase